MDEADVQKTVSNIRASRSLPEKGSFDLSALQVLFVLC